MSNMFQQAATILDIILCLFFVDVIMQERHFCVSFIVLPYRPLLSFGKFIQLPKSISIWYRWYNSQQLSLSTNQRKLKDYNIYCNQGVRIEIPLLLYSNSLLYNEGDQVDRCKAITIAHMINYVSSLQFLL